MERELERTALECVLEGRSGVGVGRPVWDEGGNFVIYPTLLGIKGESMSALAFRYHH